MTDATPWAVQRRRRFPAGQWAALEVRAAWEEVPGVRSALLVPVDGSRIEHAPGQFMTFRIPTPDGTVERCYTLSSSAARDGGVEITVKRQPGTASAHLHALMVPGTRIEGFGPSGHFGPQGWPHGPYALIAAGSGLTPMLSILRTAADRGVALDAILVQVAPTAEDMIAAGEIAYMARRLPGLVHIPVATRATGRPDAALLMRLIPDMTDRTVLTCGPQPFMEMVRATARDAGVPPDRYGEESFDFTSPQEEITPSAEARQRTITFARSGRTFPCPETSTILGAVKAAGLPLPSSCARGMCGTCKTFKHAGEVTMVHDGGIRQREIDRGFILPCVSRPLTDIVLDC